YDPEYELECLRDLPSDGAGLLMSGPPEAVASSNPGDLLWTPSRERSEGSQLGSYLRWLARERGRSFNDYASLWRYSVDELEDFWGSLWDYFELGPKSFSSVLEQRVMPGARWFPGVQLNYVERILRWPGAKCAVVHRSEDGTRHELSYAE